MIFHIPHSSRHIPLDLRKTILLDDQALSIELLVMTDAYTENLFSAHAEAEDTVVTFPVSRLIVDPERFLDDSLETMAKIGMGVIYERTSSGEPLREPPFKDVRDALIQQFYKPHHRQLTEAARLELSNQDNALIVDCHSFPSQALPYEYDQEPNRPEICIGEDEFHTPSSLVRVALESVQREGLTCKINSPFAGSIVPTRYFNQDRRVSSIMIEMNRSIYMDETTGERSDNYTKCRAAVGRILDEIRKAHMSLATGSNSR